MPLKHVMLDRTQLGQPMTPRLSQDSVNNGYKIICFHKWPVLNNNGNISVKHLTQKLSVFYRRSFVSFDGNEKNNIIRSLHIRTIKANKCG
jgi:hypothetical protein